MAKAGAYPAIFATRLMSKDMGLLLADAQERGAPMPSMAAAAQLYAYAGYVHPKTTMHRPSPRCRHWRAAKPNGSVPVDHLGRV